MNPLKLIKRLVGLGVDPAQIARPSGVSRRDFLKACGITTVSVYMGGSGIVLANKREYVMGVDWASGPDLTAVACHEYGLLGLEQAVDATKEVLLEPHYDVDAPLSAQESKILNEILFEKLAAKDPAAVKEAVDAVNDFTRVKMREDGFYRRILPPIPIENTELDSISIPKTPNVWVKEKAKPEMSQKEFYNEYLGVPYEPSVVNTPADKVAYQAGVFSKDMIAKAKYQLPKYDSTPAKVENPYFKMWVEGTYDNKTVAAEVAAEFGNRPATPEQIAEFLNQLVARHARRRPGGAGAVRSELDRNEQGGGDRTARAVRRRAVGALIRPTA